MGVSITQENTHVNCGPGTKVQKRINEGYKGVNHVENMIHILLKKKRNIADDILAQKSK